MRTHYIDMQKKHLNILNITSRKLDCLHLKNNYPWHYTEGICVPYSFIEYYSHFFLSWMWPWGHSDQTESPYNLYRQRSIHCCVHSDLFLFSTLQSFIALLIVTSGLSTAVCGVSSSSVTETLSVSPRTETPFLSLTHTARHSFLIRGGGRVEYTSCCCWPAPSKQEDLLGLITLASPFPPLQPITNKQQQWMAWIL